MNNSMDISISLICKIQQHNIKHRCNQPIKNANPKISQSKMAVIRISISVLLECNDCSQPYKVIIFKYYRRLFPAAKTKASAETILP